MDITFDKEKFRNVLMISMIFVLMGQFYISPFNIGFRLTFAVFFMSLFLIHFENYSVMMITMSVGVSTFIFRTLVYYLGSGVPFGTVVIQYLPVLSYYVFFGLFFKIFDVRSYFDQPFNFFLSLWICDAIPNIIEASVRKAWEIAEFDQLVITIIIVGVIRTILTLTVYYFTRYYTERLKRSEREKYYREIVVFISKLKTELFLLNKSRNDIESAVSYIHECYDDLEDENSMKKPLLKIAKDIHEIKKDYLRVIAGMNGVFKIDTNIKYMNIKNIFYIIKDNCEKLIESKGKKIIVDIDYNYIFETEEFYSIISILNNLTINSIDSINLEGKISIISHIELGEVVFIVEDSGGGVPKEKFDIIFKSGYTTKYDEHTGKMSTGLGLSHVKNIVEEYFKGSIKISSEVGNGTKFVIKIPRNKIVKEDDTL